ncbi:MAG: mechanosensitive ion channel [Deltaproteobacteria bacterium]|nr:mechanosensitive ion channel [Deltaproteobacteria bacterium]
MDPAAPPPATPGTAAINSLADKLAMGDSPGWLVAIVIIVVGLVIASIAGGAVERLTNKAAVGGARAKFLGGLVRWLVTALALLTGLERVGVETSSLLAVLASAGLAVGLALQGSLAHFASGVLLLIFRPFDLGDIVSVAGQTGAVVDIGVVAITLETPDRQRVVIPNSVVTSGVLVNLTRAPLRRVEVRVGLAYGVDIARAEAVLIAAARSVSFVKENEPVDVVMANLGGSAVEVVVRAWVAAVDLVPADPAVRRQVLLALREAGIEIPYQQIVVHQR